MRLVKFILNIFKTQISPLDTFEISEEVKRQNWDIKYNDLGIFSYKSDGFEIDLKNEFHSIKWTDIERVSAYKADLITTDEICLDIIYDGKTIIITEETKGWYQFIIKLKTSLPLINETWEAEVVKSPFEYNLTTIYERFDRKMQSK